MPVRDRKYYITLHNAKTKEDEAAINNRDTSSINGEAINAYADLAQKNIQNSKKNG